MDVDLTNRHKMCAKHLLLTICTYLFGKSTPARRQVIDDMYVDGMLKEGEEICSTQ